MSVSTMKLPSNKRSLADFFDGVKLNLHIILDATRWAAYFEVAWWELLSSFYAWLRQNVTNFVDMVCGHLKSTQKGPGLRIDFGEELPRMSRLALLMNESSLMSPACQRWLLRLFSDSDKNLFNYNRQNLSPVLSSLLEGFPIPHSLSLLDRTHRQHFEHAEIELF